MSNREHEPGRESQPGGMPEDLAEFLRQRPTACLLMPTEQGTVMVVKLPRRDIESARGRVPIQVRHELHSHPQAPVIRMVVTIYDRPEHPLGLETFINVEDPAQRADYAALAGQDELNMLFYDEGVRHRLSKGVVNGAKTVISEILTHADSLFAAIPSERLNFDQAKADVMRIAKL